MGESKYNDFRDLEVWKRCKSIRKQFWDVCKNFPEEEKYRLSDQILRASRSSTACIAEGYGRYITRKVYSTLASQGVQYSRQSRGSLYELIDHVDVALECKYLNNNHADSLIEEIKTAIRILNELYQIPERPQRV